MRPATWRYYPFSQAALWRSSRLSSASPGEPAPYRVKRMRSHPHEVVFDPTDTFVVVPDKGLDRIFTFRFDGAADVPMPQAEVKVREGAGPRHIVFAPGRPYAFAIDELDSTVAA